MDDKQDGRSSHTFFGRHRKNVCFRWGLTAFVVIVACILVAQLVMKFASVSAVFSAAGKALSPVLYGLVIAYLLDPIVNRVEKFLTPRFGRFIKKPKRASQTARGIGVLFSFVVVALVIWALLYLVVPQLIDSIRMLINKLPIYFTNLTNWLDGIGSRFNITDLLDQLYDFLANWISTSVLPKLQDLLMSLGSGIVSLVRTIFNLIIGIIISVYLLMGKKRFVAQAKKLCYSILGKRWGGRICNICTYANHAFSGFICGKIIDSVIIGILCYLGMRIFNIPYALLISIIVGVTNIIPFFGPYIGAIPSGLLLLVVSPIDCLYFIIFVFVLQQIDGNIIGPLILGDATGLGSFWVIVSVLLFGSFFGVIGMIIGVPTFSVIYKIISELANWSLKNKDLSTSTAEYEKWNYPPRPDSTDRWRPSVRYFRFRRKKSTAEPPDGAPSEGAEAFSDAAETPPSEDAENPAEPPQEDAGQPEE